MKKIVLFSLLVFITGAVTAQSKELPERKREQMTPEQTAEGHTNMLKEQLAMNEKQTKKVYKLYLKQANKRKSAMSENSSNERPSGTPQGGGGRPGGGSGGGMGMPPGEGMQGGGGQRPSMDQQRGEMTGNKPQQTPKLAAYEEPKKDIEKREKKMKKILNDTQYERWLEIEKETSRKERERTRREEQERLFPRAEKQD